MVEYRQATRSKKCFEGCLGSCWLLGDFRHRAKAHQTAAQYRMQIVVVAITVSASSLRRCYLM